MVPTALTKFFFFHRDTLLDATLYMGPTTKELFVQFIESETKVIIINMLYHSTSNFFMFLSNQHGNILLGLMLHCIFFFHDLWLASSRFHCYVRVQNNYYWLANYRISCKSCNGRLVQRGLTGIPYHFKSILAFSGTTIPVLSPI